MALADRRPLEFPVTSPTTISPSFHPKNLDSTGTIYNNGIIDDDLLIDEELGNLDVNDVQDLELQDDDEDDDMKDQINEINHQISQQNDLDEDDRLSINSDSLSPIDNLTPTSRSISPDSLMNSDQKLTSNSSRSSTPNGSGSGSGSIYKNQPIKVQSNVNLSNNNNNIVKKPKNTSRVPIATGISTTIPVTGEKPRPSQKDDASLEDDVLFAIFLILYEKDPDGKGMTVKQICDILIDRHPEMANLSTKTSNLVSAKLNAYVKRVEKGDSSLKYALSRDWADASPKRMVYVYRGLLTDDFHIHVKSMMENQKQQDKKLSSTSNSSFNNLSNSLNIDEDDSFEAGKKASLKPRRQTMFDLGINRNSFLSSSMDKNNLFVPYSSAPVTASLKDKLLKKPETNEIDNAIIEDQENDEQDQDQDHENDQENDDVDDKKSIFEDFEVFDNASDSYIETIKKNGKRSKSMSYLTNKKHKILTAAAAAPRAPKTPCSHSPNAAAAAAALHAAALKAINGDITKSDLIKANNMKWLNVIRSGFLSQDIGTPEDISLSDLDKYF